MRSDRDLMLRVSWAHLVEGRTQESIAQSLGLTRAKVNRLIAECRDQGLIHFVIASDARVALPEEIGLKKLFGLKDAWVVPDAETESGSVKSVGAAAGAYVTSILAPGQTLAVGWGKTLDASVSGLQPRRAQGNRIVTLLGSMARGNGLSSFDIASRYARALSAECWYLIAPRITETMEEAIQLRQSVYIREAIEIAASADAVLIGVDDLSGASTLRSTGQFTAEEVLELTASGAVCILQGEALDVGGQPIFHPLARRTVGLDLENFRHIPNRIVAAAGKRKTKSLRAILAAGHCNIVITDESTANELLASPID